MALTRCYGPAPRFRLADSWLSACQKTFAFSAGGWYHQVTTLAPMKRTPAPNIRTPCPKLWHEINGDSKTRFCDHCQLHVQNLSAMSRREISTVLARREEGRVCISYTRRSDGSLFTRRDMFCDTLLRPIRRGFAWLIAVSVPVLFGACQTQNQHAGQAACGAPVTTSPDAERVIVTGGV